MSPDFITNMLSDKELDKEYSHRFKSNTTVEFPVDVTDQNLLNQKYGQDNVKLVKSRKVYKCTVQKDQGKQFEDRVWSILYRMGFTEINGENCKVYRNSDGSITKQIDILAKYESTVLVIECKSTSKPKRPIKAEIDEFSSVKQTSDQFIKKYYNENGTKKIDVAWILATDSELLEKGTLEYAKNNQIRVINNWDYYEKLSTILGSASKYQLLANIFQQRDIKGLSPTVLAIKGTIGKYTFYQFSIKPHELMKIAFVPHHASDDYNLSLYQRLVKPGRIKNISEYIKTEGGLFPTNIVVNLSNKGKELRFDKIRNDDQLTVGLLSLPNYFGSAEIIDGQHRLFSYANIDESDADLVPVFAFENLDYDIQAKLFVQINGEQEKVKKELLNAIVGYQNWNSNDESKRFYALPMILTNKLSEEDKSPFFHKIKQDDGKTKNDATITYREISEKFKELHLFGTLKKKTIHPDLLFYEDCEKSLINGYKMVTLFFEYLMNNSIKFKEEWEKGGFFSKNNSVIPLLGIMKHILVELSKQEPILDKKVNSYIGKVYPYEDPICNYFDNMDDKEYLEYTSGAGKKGYQMRIDKLILEINKEYPEFMEKEVSEIKNKIEQRLKNGTVSESEKIRDLENKLQFTVKTILENSKGKFWITTRVPDDVRNGAISRATANGEYQDYIRGCMLIDIKKIAEYKNNNEYLDILNIYDIDKKSSRFSWISELNSIRNKLFHSGWTITDEDREIIDTISSTFDERFNRFIEENDLEEKWKAHCEYTMPIIKDE